MKKIYKYLLVAMCMATISSTINAQGWIQDRRGMHSAGIGVTQVFFLPYQYYPLSDRSSAGIALNIAGEYKVHRLIGIGWQTGVDIFVFGRKYNKRDNLYYHSTAVGIPIGFKFNVHILEATRAKIKDKLDVYAGFNIGGGPSFHSNPEISIAGFIYGGPQVGVRYWFNSKIALFTEIGWGATIVNVGVTF